MALFRRRTAADRPTRSQAAAIDRFWSWWAGGGAADVAAAVSDGDLDRVAGPLSRQVELIHPALAWEVAAGATHEHVLVVTSEGDPARRPLARAWRAAAPTAGVWEYSDTRPPAADPAAAVVTVAGVHLDLASASAHAQVVGPRLDVTVYHPGFERLPERLRRVAGYLMLTTVLGEAGVETWLGHLGASTAPALDPVPLAGLRAVVAQLAELHPGAGGS